MKILGNELDRDILCKGSEHRDGSKGIYLEIHEESGNCYTLRTSVSHVQRPMGPAFRGGTYSRRQCQICLFFLGWRGPGFRGVYDSQSISMPLG